MTSEADLTMVRSVLESDRVWSAYALADLDPALQEYASWHIADNAVVLVYHGFAPPVLFAHGDPTEVEQLFESVPAGSYVFTLIPTHRALLGERLLAERESKMWRMALREEPAESAPENRVERVGREALQEILTLFDEHPDRPDAFSPSQLDAGTFFGIWDSGSLIALAGTHVAYAPLSVAALGNIFTRPDRRGEGLGRKTTAAVLGELRRRGFQTIVLNVAMDNEPAIRIYTQLGFRPYCGYLEGTGVLEHP